MAKRGNAGNNFLNRARGAVGNAVRGLADRISGKKTPKGGKGGKGGKAKS